MLDSRQIPVKPFHVGRAVTVPIDRSIGDRMRQSREDLGLSLREVARRMKVSPMYLSDLERGFRRWTKRRLDQWHRVTQA